MPNNYNVAFFGNDDWRFDDIGKWSMPQTWRRMRKKGLLFTSCYAGWPVCGPERISFRSGQLVHNHGVTTNGTSLSGYQANQANMMAPALAAQGVWVVELCKFLNWADENTVSGLFSLAGVSDLQIVNCFATRYYGPWFNENGNQKIYKNFEYITDIVRDKVLAMLASLESKQPWCLICDFNSVHGDATPAIRYANSTIPAAPNFHTPNWNHPDSVDFNGETYLWADKPDYVTKDNDGVSLPLLGSNALQSDDMKRIKRWLVAFAVDEALNLILPRLPANTLKFLWSDSGLMLSEQRISGGKGLISYPEATHQPLIISGPGVAENESRSQLVGVTDITATIMENFGATFADAHAIDGTSLSPLFPSGSRQKLRTAMYLETPAPDFWAFDTITGLITERFTYVEGGDGSGEIYDKRKNWFHLGNSWDDPTYTSTKAFLAAARTSLATASGAATIFTDEVPNP